MSNKKRIELKVKTLVTGHPKARGRGAVVEVPKEEADALIACSYAKETDKKLTVFNDADGDFVPEGAATGDNAAAAVESGAKKAKG